MEVEEPETGDFQLLAGIYLDHFESLNRQKDAENLEEQSVGSKGVARGSYCRYPGVTLGLCPFSEELGQYFHSP